MLFGVKVVTRKYDLGEEVSLPQILNKGRASNFWQDLCSVGNIGADVGECIIQGFKFKVNSGNSIRFWHRKRLREEALKTIFSRLYRIFTQDEATEAEVQGQNRSWDS